MVFSSILFCFYFLPAVLAIYYIVPRYSSLNELIKTLENESLVTLENSTLKLLANQLEMVISPDGKTYAADNYDGKFTQWILTKTSNNMK